MSITGLELKHAQVCNQAKDRRHPLNDSLCKTLSRVEGISVLTGGPVLMSPHVFINNNIVDDNNKQQKDDILREVQYTRRE